MIGWINCLAWIGFSYSWARAAQMWGVYEGSGLSDYCPDALKDVQDVLRTFNKIEEGNSSN